VPETNNQPRVVKGASSSGTLRYIPFVPPLTAATIDATATQVVVPPPTVPTTDAIATHFVVPTAATTNENVKQSVPKEMLQQVLFAISCKMFQMQFLKVRYLGPIYPFWNWQQL